MSNSRASTAPAILLVDDNVDDLLFFRLAWERAGLTNPVRVAGSRAEAMQYLEGYGKFSDRTAYPLPSVVVLDMRLPDGQGSELVRWIRAHDQFSNLVVIVLSGSAYDAEVDQAYRNGVNSFLLKTSNPRDLQKLVNQIHAYWLTHNESPQPPRLQT